MFLKGAISHVTTYEAANKLIIINYYDYESYKKMIHPPVLNAGPKSLP